MTNQSTGPADIAKPAIAVPHPKFGDLLRNTAASERNPHRDAIFIRKVRITARLNRGLWYEMTDGKGKVWQSDPHYLIEAPSSSGGNQASAARSRDELLDYAQTFGATLGDFSGTISFEPFELERFVAALTPSPSVHRQALGDVQVAGSTIYSLNARGANRWSASVQPGRDDEDRRVSDEECEAVARALAATAAPESGWRPIETAPKGAKGVAWMQLAWGSKEDRNTGYGMRIEDKFYAAATFVCPGQEKQFELREVEVQPTHWQPLPAAPTAGETL